MAVFIGTLLCCVATLLCLLVRVDVDKLWFPDPNVRVCWLGLYLPHLEYYKVCIGSVIIL